MVLFELMASLGLDTSTFKKQADEAVADGEGVANSVSDSFEKIQTEASEADTKLNDLETKGQTTSAIMQSVVGITEELVQKAIEGIIEFGKESLEVASQSGTALAEEYLRAQERLEVSTEALKLKVGNMLLPVATVFSNFASDLMGISDSDRLLIMLDKLDSYSFENIQKLSASLDSVFGRFEKVEYGEGMNVEDMTAALDSQIEYWNQYNQTLTALQNRGVDTSFLASIADGTMQSYETMKALEEADDAQLKTIMQSYETLESVKESTVAGLNEMQLYVDEDFRAMVESVAELVVGMDQSEAAYANGMLTGNAVANGLEAAYPNIVSLVEAINGDLAKIGKIDVMSSIRVNENGVRRGGGAGTQRIPGHASGLSYVPYDDYGAYLHRGEAVLTRQQAEEYRAGSTARATDSTAVIRKLDAVVESIRGISVYLDGEKVGHALTPYVSGEIGREAGVFL